MARQSARLSIRYSALVLGLATLPVHADIYQWEYVKPGDPNQGKRQSTTLCAGGAGVSAGPSVSLYGRDLTRAYLQGANLSDANLGWGQFANADFTGANLLRAYLGDARMAGANFTSAVFTGVRFFQATLTDANFTDAQISGAIFEW